MEQDKKTASVILALAEVISTTDPSRISEGKRLAYKSLEHTGGCWVLDTATFAAMVDAHDQRFHLHRVMSPPPLHATVSSIPVEEYATSPRPVVVGPDLAHLLVLHCAEIASRFVGMHQHIESMDRIMQDKRRAIASLEAKLEGAGRKATRLEANNASLRDMLRHLLGLPKVAKIAGRAGFLRRFRVIRLGRGRYMLPDTPPQN